MVLGFLVWWKICYLKLAVNAMKMIYFLRSSTIPFSKYWDDIHCANATRRNIVSDEWLGLRKHRSKLYLRGLTLVAAYIVWIRPFSRICSNCSYREERSR